MGVNLTSGAISKIVTGKCTENDLYKPVLQVIDINSLLTSTIDNKQWCVVKLSDGSFKESVAIAYEILTSNKLHNGSIVQLTKFKLTKFPNSYIRVCDLNLLRSKCNIIGDPKVLPYNETPLMEESVTPILDQDRADPDLKVDDDSHRGKEPPALKQNPSDLTQKCSSHSPTHNKKRKLQSSDDGVGACYKKLGTLEEGVSKLTTEKNKEVDVNLTSGAISKIVTDKCTENDLKPVLQLIYIYSLQTSTINNKQWYLVWLSDGSFKEYVAIADDIFISNKLQKGSIVQLTKFQVIKNCNNSKRGILVFDLNVIRSKCGIIGHPKLLPRNEPRLIARTTPTIPDDDHANSHLNVNIDDSHHVEEPTTSIQNPSPSTQKCSNHSPTQNKKRKLQSCDDAISVLGKDISDVLKMMVEITNDVRVLYKKVETLDEDVSKMTRMMMEKNKEDTVGACFEKLEILEKDVSKLTRMMMEKNKEDDVGACFEKLEILEEVVSKTAKMMMDKNKEDDVGTCFKKLETLEEDVSKLTRMMMEKNKEDDMGACIEKLDKMGWGAEEPIYDTALLLFLKGADYRKLWLHLKPECCGKWVKIAGSIFGLLD